MVEGYEIACDPWTELESCMLHSAHGFICYTEVSDVPDQTHLYLFTKCGTIENNG